MIFFCGLLIFIKIKFFRKFVQEYHQSVKYFGSRSDQKFCVCMHLEKNIITMKYRFWLTLGYSLCAPQKDKCLKVEIVSRTHLLSSKYMIKKIFLGFWLEY